MPLLWVPVGHVQPLSEVGFSSRKAHQPVPLEGVSARKVKAVLPPGMLLSPRKQQVRALGWQVGCCRRRVKCLEMVDVRGNIKVRLKKESRKWQ